MYIQLEESDYNAIAELVANEEDTYNGRISYSDLDIEICFSKEVKMHQENHYYDGTGAWVTDSVDFVLDNVDAGNINLRYNSVTLTDIIKYRLWNP